MYVVGTVTTVVFATTEISVRKCNYTIDKMNEHREHQTS